MSMLDTIRAKRDEVYAIARRHKAENPWVFGSCARGEEMPESDVDSLVKWNPKEYSWHDYVNIKLDVIWAILHKETRITVKAA